MTISLDYQSKVRGGRRSLSARSKAAVALMIVSACLWYFSKHGSNRAVDSDVPWNIRNWGYVLWMCRMGRLNVAAALYAVVCAAKGLRQGAGAAAMIFAASAAMFAGSLYSNWRCFGIPGAYWPDFE